VRLPSLRRIGFLLAVELWPVLVIGGLVALVLRQVSESEWREVFLYNGDSLVLPLLEQSFAKGEPFHWVFSTQSFLFPEFPVFWLCSLVTTSAQSALLLNAVVNVLLLYGVMRVIVSLLAPGHRLRQVAIALLGALIFVSAVLTEQSTTILPPGIVSPISIPTLFLLTTYYYGVVLISLTTIALALWFTRRFTYGALSGPRVAVYVSVVLVIGSATMYSNPLYLLQLALPLGAVLIVLVLIGQMSLRWFSATFFPVLAAVLMGTILRIVFAEYLINDFRSYIGVTKSLDSIQVLYGVVGNWLHSFPGVLKLLLLLTPLTIALVWTIRVFARRRSRPVRPRTVELFVMIFVLLSAFSLLVGQVATGQQLTRYLIPLFIFPLLVILLLSDERSLGRRLWTAIAMLPRRVVSVAVGVLTVAAVGLSVAAIAVSVRPIQAMAETDYTPAACLNDWLDGRQLDGIGSFMTTRPIKLYGDLDGELLQVINNSIVQPWMNNLSLYQDRTFSYLLVDSPELDDDIVMLLGEPLARTECPSYVIYDYSGDSGIQLNQVIQQSYRAAVGRQG